MELKDIENSFKQVPYMDEILDTVDLFRIDNSINHGDGITGSIEITPKELTDVIAYWFMEGLNDH